MSGLWEYGMRASGAESAAGEQTADSASGAEKAGNLTTLAACCLFLSMLEYAIPKPLPFLRTGLANLPVMLALGFPIRPFCTLLLVKILAQALISGTLFSYIFLFSAAGSASGALLMYTLNLALNRAGGRRRLSFIGLGTAGAFASNTAQIALAYFFILGKSALFIAPPLLTCGIITGILLGIFCEKFTVESAWYNEVLYGCLPAPARGQALRGSGGEASRRGRSAVDTAAPLPPQGEATLYAPAIPGAVPPDLPSDSSDPPSASFAFAVSAALAEWWEASAGLALTLAFVLITPPALHVALFLIFWITAMIKHKAGKPLMTVLFFVCIAFFNLLFPYGKVLFRAGGLAITEGALINGIDKAAVFEGLIMISKLTISRDIKLPGRLGKLISGSFSMLNYLSDSKKKISAKSFIKDLDAVLSGAPRDE